jgi:hypothetical protein
MRKRKNFPKNTCTSVIFEKLALALVFSLWSSALSGGDSVASTYVVTQGDTLSHVVGRRIPGPVWGSDGSLKDVLALNPNISDIDTIIPGQIIDLGPKAVPEGAPDVTPQVATAVGHSTATDRKPQSVGMVQSSDSLPSSYDVSAQKDQATPLAGAPASTPSESIDYAKKTTVSSPSPSSAAPLNATPRGEGGPAVVANIPFEPIHSFAVGLGYDFLWLNATDSVTSAQASLRTNYAALVSMQWSIQWTESFSSILDFGVETLDFAPSTNVLRSLNGTTQNLFHLYFGAENALGGRFSLRYGAGVEQVLGLHGLDTYTVQIDSIAVPTASAGVKWEALDAGHTSFGLFADFKFYGPSSTDGYLLKAGDGFRGGIIIQRKSNVSGEPPRNTFNLGFQERNQATGQVSLQEYNYFFKFSFPLTGN